MPLQRPFRRFAPHHSIADGATASECCARERLAGCGTAVVHQSVGEELNEVEVDTSGRSVVADEVPRPLVAPREQPVNACCNESGHGAFECRCIQLDIEVSVWASLPTEQRIDTPTAADHDLDIGGLQGVDHVDRVACAHLVDRHGTDPTTDRLP